MRWRGVMAGFGCSDSTAPFCAILYRLESPSSAYTSSVPLGERQDILAAVYKPDTQAKEKCSFARASACDWFCQEILPHAPLGKFGRRTMIDYDSPWKEALDVFFKPFLELFFPGAHADIDWDREWVSLDKELQQIAPDAEIGRRYVDKLFKVWLKNGEEQWVLVHVEVQMSSDDTFPWRMYVYNYRIFDKYNREVASFAVLGDDDPSWRPSSFGYRRWGVEVDFRFPTVKLLDYAARRPELEASENPFATVILAHLDTQETRRDQGERKERKFRLFKRLFERGWNEKQIRDLFRLIDWMMDLPQSLTVQLWDQLKQYREERHMPFITTPERMGRLEGRLEGRAEGLVRGIEAVLRVRFRQTADDIMPEIRGIRDGDELEKILHAAETVANPEELQKLLAAIPTD
jgi:hypothetical protein